MSPLYIYSLKKSNTFWSKFIDKFWSAGIETFCPKIHSRKIGKSHKDFWIIIKSPYVPKFFDTTKSCTGDAH